MADSLDVLRRFEDCTGSPRSLGDADRRAIDQEIDEMLQKISAHSDADSADLQLQHLGTIQEILATLAFKHGARLSHRQREIVRQYDRSDVLDERRRIFKLIKQGDFPWKPTQSGQAELA